MTFAAVEPGRVWPGGSDDTCSAGPARLGTRDGEGLRIAYLTGSFPSPTHTFFWREIAGLRRLGVRVDIVSTRRSRARAAPHAWVAEAMAQTTYLMPMGLKGWYTAMGALLAAGARGWGRAWRAWRASGGGWRHQLRLLGACLLGARLAELARRRGWQHIHVGFTEGAADVALFANRLSRVPYSVSLGHQLANAGPGQREKWRHASFGLPNTQYLRRQVDRELAGALPPIVEVAPRGVDTEEFRRSRPYLPWSGEGPARLFSCGRLVPPKGHADVIAAIAALKERGLDARVRIAGEDPTPSGRYSRELLALAHKLGVQDKVDLLGLLGEDAVRQEAEAAHLFVLATHDESFGNAVAEAMAMGLPVVTTKVGGLPELVDSGVNGLLVPPRNASALAGALERLLRDPASAARLGAQAREKMARDFGPLCGAKVILDCLRRATRPANEAGRRCQG